MDKSKRYGYVRLFLSDFSHIFSSSFILAASRVRETFLNQVLKCCERVRKDSFSILDNSSSKRCIVCYLSFMIECFNNLCLDK
jgi:hypothetical protein